MLEFLVGWVSCAVSVLLVKCFINEEKRKNTYILKHEKRKEKRRKN